MSNCEQHKRGTLKGSTISFIDSTGNQRTIESLTKTNFNGTCFFLEGIIDGNSYALNVSQDQKCKSNKCKGPEGGTQTDDEPPEKLKVAGTTQYCIVKCVNDDSPATVFFVTEKMRRYSGKRIECWKMVDFDANGSDVSKIRGVRDEWKP